MQQYSGPDRGLYPVGQTDSVPYLEDDVKHGTDAAWLFDLDKDSCKREVSAVSGLQSIDWTSVARIRGRFSWCGSDSVFESFPHNYHIYTIVIHLEATIVCDVLHNFKADNSRTIVS